eukprot:TRINITY_DN30572_c0_g1_i1.p1 TRINITY_DN30572_c0_g1~~TRINITY_DN30572_c0_g1_i1.p1  ORF type:complete len:505 (+),score=138.88 TRINITY_DN30572_c0_g1_i1:54-1517(+)
MKRKTCNDAQVIKQVVAPHFLQPHVIDYTGDLDAPTDSVKILHWKQLLRDCRASAIKDQNLTSKAADKAFLEHMQDNEEKWHLAGDGHAWATRNAARLRAMIRHFNQSEVKSKSRATRPKWISEMLGDEEEGDSAPPAKKSKVLKRPAASGSRDGGDAAHDDLHPKFVDTDLYDVGYDEDMQAAWRRLKTAKKGTAPEWSKKQLFSIHPADEKPSQAVYAQFNDYTLWSPPSLCARDLERLNSTRKQPLKDVLFQVECNNGGRVRVQSIWRKGVHSNNTLWFLEQGKGPKQLCCFTDLSAASVDLLKDFATRYSKGTMSKEDMDTEKRIFMDKTKGKKKTTATKSEAAPASKPQRRPSAMKQPGASRPKGQHIRFADDVQARDAGDDMACDENVEGDEADEYEEEEEDEEEEEAEEENSAGDDLVDDGDVDDTRPVVQRKPAAQVQRKPAACKAAAQVVSEASRDVVASPPEVNAPPLPELPTSFFD